MGSHAVFSGAQAIVLHAFLETITCGRIACLRRPSLFGIDPLAFECQHRLGEALEAAARCVGEKVRRSMLPKNVLRYEDLIDSGCRTEPSGQLYRRAEEIMAVLDWLAAIQTD